MTTHQLKRALHQLAKINECFYNIPIDPVVESIRRKLYLHVYDIALKLTNTEEDTDDTMFRTINEFKDRLEFINEASEDYEPYMKLSGTAHPIYRMCFYLMETNAGQTMVKEWIKIFSSVK